LNVERLTNHKKHSGLILDAFFLIYIVLYQRHIKDGPFVICLNVKCVGIVPNFFRYLIMHLVFLRNAVAKSQEQ